ncbi:MAG TPA: hypothetical protein VF988_01670, partial [Verrucomicrobiae bacterium]
MPSALPDLVNPTVNSQRPAARHARWVPGFFRRWAPLLLFLWLPALAAVAADTNYYCVVCGKGPLKAHVWLHPRGPLCEDCKNIRERCSICGLPVKDGDGHIQTSDGRFICKFDKTNAVLTQEQANDLFEQTRGEVVDLYGRQFALKNPDVTVKLFDVDYWSEKGRGGGLHKFG